MKKPKYAVSFEMDTEFADGSGAYPTKYVKEDVKSNFPGVSKLKVVKAG